MYDRQKAKCGEVVLLEKLENIQNGHVTAGE